MAKRVIWSEDAYLDKVNIFSYWNNRNKSNLYSKKLNKLFKDTIKLILETPSLGRTTNIKDIKRIIMKEYFLVYMETDSTLTILRIWDTRQDHKGLNYFID